MSGSNFSIPGGHGVTISFTVSGAVASAIATVFATELANLGNNLFVAEFPTHSIDIGGVASVGGTESIRIDLPGGGHSDVSVSVPGGSSDHKATKLIQKAINAQLGGTEATFKHGSKTILDLAVGQLGTHSGPVTLSPDVETTLPKVPPGKEGLLIVQDTTGGIQNITFTGPGQNGITFVLNTSTGDVVFNASGDPQVLSTGTGSTTMFGGAAGGSDVAAHGNNLFQALATGGGQYFISFGDGSDTVWANSGNDVIAGGSGANVIGLGSGDNFVASTGSDTIIAGSGHASVVAGPGSTAVIFGSSSSLLFVGDGTGTSATIVGATGNQTLFGGAGGSGLFFVGNQSFLLDAQGASDTVVAGAGSSTAALFAENGGSVTLFSPQAGNVLVAGAGNVTLNAGGGTATVGGNSLWAGTGSDSLVGGAGSDVFAFVNGGAGGADTIGNWTAKDTLALLGYGPNGITSQTTDPFGNAVIKLSDGTSITIQGVGSIPSSHIFLS